MNQAGSPSAPFTVLLQATTVLVLFQAVFVLARLFNDDENSGGMTAILVATVMQFALTRRLSVDPQGRHAGAYVAVWRYAALALLGVLTAMVAFDAYAPAAMPKQVPTSVAMLVPAVIALKGAVLGKLKPGGVLGLRTRWTRQSRLAWELAHRLMGRILFVGGLIGVAAAPFIPVLATFAGISALVLIAMTAGTIKSWRVWKSDPERIGG
jgi:uncharacterized membrane protein